MRKPSGASPAPDALLSRFREANGRYHLLDGGEAVLVAVSGGPDSVALLHLLYTLREEFSLTLSIAHLHHGLRGAEADADAEYVAALAQGMDLPIFSERADVLAHATQRGLSTEMAAREVRYAFLERVAAEHACDRIAVGHTASDRVETTLLHLLRGSGLPGLRGMPPQRGPVIRPLITAWRAETEAYCREHDLQPREDLTNLQPEAALRNRLRHELLPQLREQYNPALDEALLRLAGAAEAELDWTEPLVRETYACLAQESPEGLALDLAGLRELAPGLRYRVWREAWNQIHDGDVELQSAHYDALERLLSESQTGRKTSLPADIAVQKGYNKVFLSKDSGELDLPGGWPERTLPIGGAVQIPELGLIFGAEILAERPAELGQARGNQIVVDAEAVSEPLSVRSWLPGEALIPLGMSGHKKLQDLLVDAKVPAGQRSQIPVVVDARGEILWVVGVAMADPSRLTPATRRYLRLTVSANEMLPQAET